MSISPAYGDLALSTIPLSIFQGAALTKDGDSGCNGEIDYLGAVIACS